MTTPFSESDFIGFSLLFLPFLFLAWGEAPLHTFLLTYRAVGHIIVTRRAGQRC